MTSVFQNTLQSIVMHRKLSVSSALKFTKIFIYGVQVNPTSVVQGTNDLKFQYNTITKVSIARIQFYCRSKEYVNRHFPLLFQTELVSSTHGGC